MKKISCYNLIVVPTFLLIFILLIVFPYFNNFGMRSFYAYEILGVISYLLFITSLLLHDYRNKEKVKKSLLFQVLVYVTSLISIIFLVLFSGSTIGYSIMDAGRTVECLAFINAIPFVFWYTYLYFLYNSFCRPNDKKEKYVFPYFFLMIVISVIFILYSIGIHDMGC